jgi:hypothetical protein
MKPEKRSYGRQEYVVIVMSVIEAKHLLQQPLFMLTARLRQVISAAEHAECPHDGYAIDY